LVVNRDYIGFCEHCQKRKYGNRKSARVVARRMGGGHVVAYRCPSEKEFWHVGHLPTPVIKGIVTREEIT
jgi:hypothetical protein